MSAGNGSKDKMFRALQITFSTISRILLFWFLFTKNFIAFIFKSPKYFIYVAIGVFVIILVSLNIFRHNIILHEIILPEIAIKSGLSPQVITRNAYKGIRGVIEDQIKQYSRESVGSFRKIEGNAECIKSFDISYWDILDYMKISKAYINSQIPDITIPVRNFSVSYFSFIIKKYLGLWHVEIQPSLVETKTGFVLRLAAYGRRDKFIELEESLRSLEELELSLSRMLATVLVPDFSAYKRRSRDPSNIKNELFIAREILEDDVKEALILLFSANGFKYSNVHSEILTNMLLADFYYNEIENNFDLSFFNEYEAVIRLSMLHTDLYFAIIAEREDKEQGEKLLKKIVNKAYKIYNEHNNNYVSGIFLAEILRAAKQEEEAVKIFTQSANTVYKEKSIPNHIVSKVWTAHILWLLSAGKTEEAVKILNDRKYGYQNYRSETPEDIRVFIDGLEALIEFRNGDPDKLIEFLESVQLDSVPCTGLMVIQEIGLGKFIYGETTKYKNKIVEEISEEVELVLLKYESMGLKNHELYETWGNFLSGVAKYSQSYEKYENALSFPGDHVLTLLNWGYAAFKNRDYELAIKKYSESLDLGTVSKAVYGLLESLSQAEKSKEYLSEYERFFSVLEDADEDRRIRFSSMTISHDCKVGGNGRVRLLVAEGALDTDNFDRERCGWLRN